VAEAFLDRDLIDVLGVGMAPSQGVASGVVEDSASASRCVREALQSAEAMADVDVQTAVVSLGGEHLASQTEIGMLEIPGNRPVTADHLESVRMQGQEITLPPGREVVHVDACDYGLDARRGLASPLGMSGSQLEAQLNIVTGAAVARGRIEEAMQRADLTVHQFALEGLATGIACLSEEERQLGVSLVSIGGGTTNISHFRHGALSFHSVLPLGGEIISKDIASCLTTTLGEGERLKLAFGDPQVRGNPQAEITYRMGAEQEMGAVTVDLLSQIMGARVEEILEMARDRLMVRGCLAASPCGLVLAGGSSRLPGLVETARRLYGGMPTKVAEPRRIGNGMELVRDPSTHAALGLTILAGDWTKAEISRAESMGLFERLWLAVKDLIGIGRKDAPATGPAAPGAEPENGRG
jgi:cell division protein FtsA